MSIAVLNTRLFPDSDTVSASLQRLDTAPDIIDCPAEDAGPAAWDDVLGRLLAAERVMTL